MAVEKSFYWEVWELKFGLCGRQIEHKIWNHGSFRGGGVKSWRQKQSIRSLAVPGWPLLPLLPERLWDLISTIKLKSKSLQKIWFRVENISVNLWSLHSIFFQEQRTRVSAYLPAMHTHLFSFPVPRHVFWQGSLDRAVSGLVMVRLEPQPKELQSPLMNLVRNSLTFMAAIVWWSRLKEMSSFHERSFSSFPWC